MRPDIRYNNIIDSDEARLAQAAADKAPNLPAAQIDADKFYITQNYTKYTRDDHDVWHDLFHRRWTVLEQQVSRQFIDGMKILRLSGDRIPLLDDLTLDRDITVAGGKVLAKGTRLDGINKFLQAQSNWASYGVPGLPPRQGLLRLPRAARVPHHRAHPPARGDGLPPRARHLPRRLRPRPPAHAQGLRRLPPDLRQGRAALRR